MAKIARIIFLNFLILIFVGNQVKAAFPLGKGGPKISGFAEIAFGGKLGTDTTKEDDYNMLEERLQLKTTFYPEWTSFLEDSMAEINFRADLVLDEYFAVTTDWDLRELNFALSPFDGLDLKIGRQVFTWGTGDYLFVNDLFPKDYLSFFIGRDDEYLKKPSDGVRFSFYPKAVNIDFVVIPLFEANDFPQGDRLSFFDSFQGGIAARKSERAIYEPSRKPKNAEFATRVYRNLGSYEAALYAFRGFYKMPRGYLSEMNRQLFYPRLDAYGLSLRGSALTGIANFEFAYYNSRQDSDGNNRLIENSMVKYLFGYAKDLGNDLSAGLQYLYEQTLDYDNYRSALMPADFRWDKNRHLVTVRLTKLFKSQTVKVNLFAFFSPSDRDTYIRPSIDYDINDHLKCILGANLIWGEDNHTEFGQMEKNKNIYLRLRYSF